MPMFIRHRAHAGGLHDHIVDNSSGDEEVRHHHQRVDGHGGGHVNPSRPLQLDVGALEDGEGQPEQRLHGGGSARATVSRRRT